MMVEGVRATQEPLVLEIWRDGNLVCERTLPLSLDGVEKMYRWINLRAVAGGSETRPTDLNEPANYPDHLSNGKNFIFVHGYNVDEQAARAWNSEIYKRLYWAGSRAKFYAVTWYGNDRQIHIPLLGDLTPDYHVNVIHAFQTAAPLAAEVNGLSGENIVAAHSLGCMVVSAAIQDHGMRIAKYYMINAAVAMEAYDAYALTNTMRHPDWEGYSNLLWASEWHNLFSDSDGRRFLTWRNRFGDLANAYQYYSSGEDVLNNSDGTLPWVGAERAWVNQEMRKGTWLITVGPGNSEAGWGFNYAYTNENGFLLSPLEANALTSDQIRTNSFFALFDDEDLYGANGSFVAQQPAILARLLADALPALSSAMGRNRLHDFGAGQVDMMDLQNGWPMERLVIQQTGNRWLHSDLKDAAFPYVYRLFEDVVARGLR